MLLGDDIPKLKRVNPQFHEKEFERNQKSEVQTSNNKFI